MKGPLGAIGEMISKKEWQAESTDYIVKKNLENLKLTVSR